jgi:hypothetical protein
MEAYVDEVRVFDRALSHEQVLALYRGENSIVSNETVLGSTWIACATPNDGYSYGERICSSTITIVEACTLTAAITNNILGSSGCSFSTDFDFKGGNFSCSGTGSVTISANLTNFTQVVAQNECIIRTQNGGGFRE